MRLYLLPILLLITISLHAQIPNNAAFNAMLESYHTESLKYNPTAATQIGVNEYNDQLAIEFTDSHRALLREQRQSFQPAGW